MRATIRVLLILLAVLMWQGAPAHALLLCAKLDKKTGELKDGTQIKLRVACKTKKDGTPVEVEIGSTDQLKAIPTIAGRLNTVSSVSPNGQTKNRWTDNGDGTLSDKLTGLLWELKTDDGTIHDQDNTYSWCHDTSPQDTLCDDPADPPDGTAFTVFVAGLNTPPCFAGHCDWRLPTIDELQTILEPARVCAFPPCPLTTIPGPTVLGPYWSASPNPAFSFAAWIVNFDFGTVGGVSNKGNLFSVRAVRSGS